MRRREKLLLSAIVVGLLGTIVGLGVFGAFRGTTQNSGNQLTSGTVSFTDNDAGSALYMQSDVRPGESFSRCIKATYTGSLTATARLYSQGTPGALAPYVDVVITPGTQPTSSFPTCTGFVADTGGAIYTGTLQNFLTNRTSFANGIATAPGGTTTWANGSSVVYRVQATLQAAAPDSVQGASSGVHSFVWEAQSQ